MADDILLAKASIIERSVRRAWEELEAAGANFATDFTHQDAALLNVNRACEAAIQMAAHTVARLSLGLPGNAREAFELLGEAAVPADLIALKLAMPQQSWRMRWRKRRS